MLTSNLTENIGSNNSLFMVEEKDLSLILKWRNHSEVRNMMFNDHVITQIEHEKWWEKVKIDNTKKCFLYKFEGVPTGFINFFDIDNVKKTCHWGFYLDNFRNLTSQQRIKVWFDIEKQAIQYAFDRLGSESLICETFLFNTHVLQMHKKFGFVESSQYKKEKNGKLETVIEMILNKPASINSLIVKEEVQAFEKNRIKVAFLGSANWDLIALDFKSQFEKYLGESIDIVSSPFGQYKTQLIDLESQIRSANLDYIIFCERFEDFLDSASSIFSIEMNNIYSKRIEEYCEVIRSARNHLSGKIFVMDLAPVRVISTTLNDSSDDDKSASGYLANLNIKLKKLCEELPECYLITLSSLIKKFGAMNANPGKYWYLGRIAYKTGFGNLLNTRLLQTIISLESKNARVLVFDLDNTLWGGVIGEDGLGGIQLGGDYPGNVYVEIQEMARTLLEKGFVLAICSKNTESVATEAIKTHPSMKLKLEDFASIKINWQDKAENLRSIAKELNVGISSLCLIDDSPYERAAIQKLLPEVIVPDMPTDITSWTEFLLDSPFLGTLTITEEDKKRTLRYQARNKIQKDAEIFENKEEYWHSLEMRLFFHNFNDGNRQRVLQLISKTNQFNMTTRRHGVIALNNLIEEGGILIPIGLSDKYSEHEIIGVLILQLPNNKQLPVVIETFLLSCRVLGRSVETGILGWVCGFTESKGFKDLIGSFTPTERNEPASKVYAAHGFTEINENQFLLDNKKNKILIPKWFQIIESF